jgi:hypothetical protein
VRAIIKLHDAEGSKARKPGIKRKRALKRPVIPGPNHLWSIDGYNKFRNYRIEIYATISCVTEHPSLVTFLFGTLPSNFTYLPASRRILEIIL